MYITITPSESINTTLTIELNSDNFPNLFNLLSLPEVIPCNPAGEHLIEDQDAAPGTTIDLIALIRNAEQELLSMHSNL